MGDISWDGAAYVRRLQKEHNFYVTFEELGGEENIAPFRTVLRRAAKAVGMRVQTFRGAHEPILWLVDRDYTPSLEQMRKAVEAASLETLPTERPSRDRGHLRIVD